MLVIAIILFSALVIGVKTYQLPQLTNPIIGIVVNVLEEEHKREAREETLASGEPTLLELRDEIRSLQLLIRASTHSSGARQPESWRSAFGVWPGDLGHSVSEFSP